LLCTHFGQGLTDDRLGYRTVLQAFYEGFYGCALGVGSNEAKSYAGGCPYLPEDVFEHLS